MIVQFVKFPSGLSEQQVRQTMEDRAPQFRALPGLVQKYYGRERESGEFCGIYIWDSEESLAAFRASDLARSIPAAYQVTSQPRVELFDVLFPLRAVEQAPRESESSTAATPA
jgi:heme-degrading monooxygenase HmoA